MELAWLFQVVRVSVTERSSLQELECKEFVKERQPLKLKQSVSRYECSPVDVLNLADNRMYLPEGQDDVSL